MNIVHFFLRDSNFDDPLWTLAYHIYILDIPNRSYKTFECSVGFFFTSDTVFHVIVTGLHFNLLVKIDLFKILLSVKAFSCV